MTKKIYAVADKVPDDCGYITAGKRYEAFPMCDGFEFYNDRGHRRFSLWDGSGHLDGGNWRRIEEDDAAEPVTLRPGDYVLTADIKDEAEFIAVRDAFVKAGAEKGVCWPHTEEGIWPNFGWDVSGEINRWHPHNNLGLRQLTVAQVLGTVKPTFTPTPGWKLTRDGRKAYVGYVREDGAEFPLVGHLDDAETWCADGKYFSGDNNPYDLVSDYVEPRSGEVWVYIDRDGGAHLENVNNHISRICVPWKEGQFDE